MLAYFAGALFIIIAGFLMAVAFDWGYVGDFILQLVTWLRGNPWETALISIFLIGIGIALMFIPKPRRFDEPAFHTTSKWGEVRVTYDAIKEIVARSAVSISGVRQIETQLHHRDNDLEIRIVAQLDPEVVIPEVSEQVQAQVKVDVERSTGIKVTEVKVLVRSVNAQRQARVR